jgi:hypothetical protein
MNWLIGLIGVGAAILLALLLWWLFQRSRPPFLTSPGSPNQAGYSIWSFQGGRWSLQEDRSASGYVPGPPPTEAGQFDGDCMRVTSVRNPEAR